MDRQVRSLDPALKRPEALGAENQKLKEMYSDLSLEQRTRIDFLKPGQPNVMLLWPSFNPGNQAVNRTYREALLDALIFHTVAEVQATTGG